MTLSRRSFLKALPAVPAALPAIAEAAAAPMVAPEFGAVVGNGNIGVSQYALGGGPFVAGLESHLGYVPGDSWPPARLFVRDNDSISWREVSPGLDIGDTAAGLDGEYADELAADWRDWPPTDLDDEHAYIARAAAALEGE